MDDEPSACFLKKKKESTVLLSTTFLFITKEQISGFRESGSAFSIRSRFSIEKRPESPEINVNRV